MQAHFIGPWRENAVDCLADGASQVHRWLDETDETDETDDHVVIAGLNYDPRTELFRCEVYLLEEAP